MKSDLIKAMNYWEERFSKDIIVGVEIDIPENEGISITVYENGKDDPYYEQNCKLRSYIITYKSLQEEEK